MTATDRSPGVDGSVSASSERVSELEELCKTKDMELSHLRSEVSEAMHGRAAKVSSSVQVKLTKALAKTRRGSMALELTSSNLKTDLEHAQSKMSCTLLSYSLMTLSLTLYSLLSYNLLSYYLLSLSLSLSLLPPLPNYSFQLSFKPMGVRLLSWKRITLIW